MKVMKDMTKEIRLRGRMDAENVIELLAADCQKPCLHPGGKNGIFGWRKMKKKMVKERWKNCINKR